MKVKELKDKGGREHRRTVKGEEIKVLPRGMSPMAYKKILDALIDRGCEVMNGIRRDLIPLFLDGGREIGENG